MKYRYDIDGLRCIAVLLVILFHYKIGLFPSGFIGVDVFFVISGYLITTGIKNDLEKGQFSFINFFKRRLWRLQPVFIALIIFTTLVTTLTYLPEDYLKYTNSLQYSAAFLANNYFSNLNNGYFADDVNVMPLLHTWSLSVEWQWYFILPFLMYLFFKTFRIKNWLYWILPLTLLFISCIHFGSITPRIIHENGSSSLSFFFNKNDTLGHYYSFTGRIFEMLIGASLAVIGSSKVNRIPVWLNSCMGLISIAVIIIIGVKSRTVNFYPNKYALFVCLNTALLIYLGSAEKKGVVTRILSIKPFVFIGLISYSLYIWHWPVLAFIRNLSIEETWLVSVSAILLSFLLAFLSYRYIESYFRKKHTYSFATSLIILVIIPYLFVSFLEHKNEKNYGMPERLGSNFIESVQNKSKQYDWSNRLKQECVVEDLSLLKLNCYFNDEAENKAIIMGDSYSDHSWQFVKALVKDKDISLESSSQGGCLAITNNGSPCQERINDNYKKIEEGNYKYVIISQTWARYISQENYQDTAKARQELENGLERSIQTVINSKAQPIIIVGIFDAYENQNPFYLTKKQQNLCVMQQYKLKWFSKDTCDFDSNYQNDQYRIWIDQMFLRLQDKFPELILINMFELQCPNGQCRTDIAGYPVYRDWSHLTDYAAYKFGEEYLNKYPNPFD